MRRAALLRAGACALSASALAPLTTRVLASDVVEYRLRAGPMRFAALGEAGLDAVAYNRSLPGPLLRVRAGQRVRVHYENHTAEPTSVHWHGMILPNAMDGASGVTQSAVQPGGSFRYEFTPNPAGTRWYHDHGMGMGANVIRGLFGMFIVDDPRDEPADAEFTIVLHDVPSIASVEAAMRGVSHAPMVDPLGSPELRAMRPGNKMGDEVAYTAHCINGAAYPKGKTLPVKVGQRVRLRILNANQTQTRYLRLAEHRLRVTHADGNALALPLEVDALRLGVGERYDAWFEVRKPGAWLLQAVSSDPLIYQQAVVFHTEGMEHASAAGVTPTLAGVDFFTYEKAAGIAPTHATPKGSLEKHFTIGGGEYGSSRWTLNGKTWPHTEKIHVRKDDEVVVRFTNKTDMDHPMHLHGHVFDIVEIGGRALARPLAKDISLVRSNGGTLTWRFKADSPPGRWLLHCHNDIHMMDGMMTEVVYI